MRISIRQLKQIIKEQIEESGEDRDDWAEERINADRQGLEPSERGGRLSKEELVDMFEDAVRADDRYDYKELKQEILDRMVA
jgi:hypothetical protein